MALTRLRSAGIAPGAVTSTAIAAGAVDITDIADGAILTAKIADNAIVTGKIADANITSSKIADSITLATPTLTSPIVNSPTINSPTVSLGSIAGSTVEKLFERANVQSSAAPASLTFNVLDQTLLVFTSNSTANVSINFTGNSTTTLESLLSGGSANTVTAVLAITNGATPYYVNNVQVDGRIIHNATISGNLFWQGNVLTVPGTAVGVDLYSFTIVRRAGLNYLVLASQTDFKSFKV